MVNPTLDVCETRCLVIFDQKTLGLEHERSAARSRVALVAERHYVPVPKTFGRNFDMRPVFGRIVAMKASTKSPLARITWPNFGCMTEPVSLGVRQARSTAAKYVLHLHWILR